jgi:hypothetical protein
MDITEKYFYSYEDFPEKQKYIDAHDAGNSSLAIADYLGLKGMVSTISTACSSAANAIMMGAKLKTGFGPCDCWRNRFSFKIYFERFQYADDSYGFLQYSFRQRQKRSESG